MTTSFTSPTSSERLDLARSLGLEPETLIQAFRLMQTSRLLDDREILLKRQKRIFFQISGAGHEAIQVAAGHGDRAGLRLVLSLLSRPRALPDLGMTPLDMLLQAVGAADGPVFRRTPDAVALGRPGEKHRRRLFGHGHAVRSGRRMRRGTALPLSGRRRASCSPVRAKARPAKANSGSRINHACLSTRRCIFLIEDNGYAISVPVENQTPGGSISKLLADFPGLLTLEVSTVRISCLPTGPCGPPPPIAAKATDRRWCTRTASGPIRIPTATTRRFYKTKREREDEARARSARDRSRNSCSTRALIDTTRTRPHRARDSARDPRGHALAR